jgi:5'-phosphate synthase pdxT subunit
LLGGAGIAAARQDRVLVTTFHPELTSSLAFHHYFAEICRCEVDALSAVS